MDPHLKYIPSIFIIWALFSTCERSDDVSEQLKTGLITDNRIISSGVERDYILFVPEDQENSPVVILLHGNSDSAEGLIGESNAVRSAPYRRWVDIASENNLILVVPNGSTGSTGDQGWNDCRSDATGNPTSNDTEFIASVLDEVAHTYAIDDSRIYVNGSSNGGHMAMRLAQEMPDRIAAIAVIIASMPVNTVCDNSQVPISILLMNGTDDPISPFNGGEINGNRGLVMSTEETINLWVARNGTETTPELTGFEDIDSSEGTSVEKFLYPNGVQGTEVVFYRINGGGHTEPSIAERYSELFKLVVGEQNGDIEMATEVWNFFKDKTR